MILVEAVPAQVSEAIVERTSIPVIGCGAGPACHGQVVVTQDLAGLTDWQPAFARPLADLGAAIQSLGENWVKRVGSGNLGTHPYEMAAGEELPDQSAEPTSL